MKKQRVVITGGGTGGHIYPGLAIAQEIRKNHPEVEVHFVGAQGGLEEKIFPKYSFPYHLIKIGRLHSSVGVAQQLKTMLFMPFSLMHAAWIFLKIRPRVVLGVGGFASGPFLFIGWMFGAKTALWEPNAYPGLTNRWLARLVNTSFIVFSEAAKFLPAKHVVEAGMPVRAEFFNNPGGKTAAAKLQILVFGGSQGARAINDMVANMIKRRPTLLNVFNLKHQTGSRDFDRIKEVYGNLENQLSVVEYIHDMPSAIAACDMVICRSGASTVAEIIASRKPAIFIPLPTAADNHQLKNAQAVAVKHAAIVMEQKDLTAEKLETALLDLHEHRDRLSLMSEKLQQFDFSNSCKKIASHLVEGTL